MKKLVFCLVVVAGTFFAFGFLWHAVGPQIYSLAAAVASVDFTSLRKWQQGGGLPGEMLVNKTYLQLLCPEAPPDARDLSLEPVSREHPLSLEYVPPHLVELTGVRTVGVQCATEETAAALKQLLSAAAQDGVVVAVASGYRRPEIQQLAYEGWSAAEGPEKTKLSVAEPGHSEHQTGTAVDFSGQSQHFAAAQDNFGETPEGRWLARNAYRYGFTLSYPDREGEYMYEPWHFRYVDKPMARLLRDRNLSYNEYKLFVPKGATSSVDIIMYNNPKLF